VLSSPGYCLALRRPAEFPARQLQGLGGLPVASLSLASVKEIFLLRYEMTLRNLPNISMPMMIGTSLFRPEDPLEVLELEMETAERIAAE
jgi:hypothetical protein